MHKVTANQNIYLRFKITLDFDVFRDGQQRVLLQTWIGTLFEGVYLHLKALIFANDFLCVFVSVKRIHQNQRDVGLVLFVKMLKQ